MPTAMSQGAAAAPATARHISSSSIPTGGFTPGTILADRYRVIGLLGRGGMGEVYRADDLKLGQPVALKFLPRALASDPVRRERFFAEVRITRQLAHPNICRVYDIDEIDGQHFLSMEYIDGEDLASLLKRIGYLPGEKALDIARQYAAGLAAAHEKGVLHRDLKPANLMIDGHGRVRITDFGLAVAAGEDVEAAEILGTPAYMAPEQFAGKGATTRSDIYAMGLILYEIYSGKRAFTATTIAELRQQKESQSPTAPSEIRRGLDPVVDRLIMRCVEGDPNARPASVAQLAMALPGGDPLAAAIAAGETPSPEMVASSGLKEGLRPAIAIGCVAIFMAGLILSVVLSDRRMRALQAEKAPAVLVEESRALLKRLGYAENPRDSVFGFLGEGPSKAVFWYRQSPEDLQRADYVVTSFGITSVDPSLQVPGEAIVTKDLQGHLLSLRVIPPKETQNQETQSSPDWSPLFLEAGSDISKWTAVPPQMTPGFYADRRAAWEGLLPGQADAPARVEAAALEGKPLSFEIIVPRQPTASERAPILAIVAVVVLLVAIANVTMLVRRNLRLGRGDRRGAKRLVIINMIGFGIYWFFTGHHVLSGEFLLILKGIAGALLTSLVFWMFYIALEPLVRRRWPQILISWSRLLSGEWRDPLVGREILIGCIFGVALTCIAFKRELVPVVNSLNYGSRVGSFVGFLANVLPGTILALGFLCLLCIFQFILRSDSAAMVLTVLVPSVVSSLLRSAGRGSSTGSSTWLGFVIDLTIISLSMLVLTRFGLLALAVGNSVTMAFRFSPMTLDSSAWYSTAGFAAVALLAGLALFGFYTSLGGRPLLALGSED